jgi:amino acid adenylation domain-containing protein
MREIAMTSLSYDIPLANENGEVFVFRTSFAQERLWFFDQFYPDSPVYNIPTAMRVPGMLNVEALERDLNEIVRRHEALRTTFAVIDGQPPMQVVVPALTLELPIVDLRKLPQAQRQSEAGRLANEEAQRPFDLARGPLLRALLLRLGDEDHVLVLTMHHIVSDGWSMGVLFRELNVLYGAYVAGRPSPLPELPIQYADFAHWQREWLQGEVLEAQLSYWKEQLKDTPAVLELPTDRPRPAVQSFRGALHYFVLPRPLSEELKALSRREDATLFMTLLAAFKTLLYRYTGQTDLVVGTPIANRTRAELEELIGFFVNTLALYTDLGGNPSFRELLGRVRAMTLEAYTHQDLPFERLVNELQPQRNLSYHPLFQVMFVLQNTLSSIQASAEVPRRAAEATGEYMSLPEIGTGTAKFDLTLSMAETGQGLVGAVEYNTDLFDAATIERMTRNFQVLLQGIVVQPEHPLSDLPILTPEERQRLLVEWNETQANFPKEVCIHQLFEAQVEKTPEVVALAFEDQRLMTYRELNARANQVGHYLRKQGVGPEVRVGLCVERSVEMIVGLLGVLKAGGAYVPLDPAYPQERLAFMLKDAQVSVLLTQQRLLDGLLSYKGQAICLDSDWETIAREHEDNLSTEVTADNLAYVIYTSGSTGKPKGVAMHHRPLVNLISWQILNSPTPFCKALQFASLSFDVSFQEMFSTWCPGGTLVLITEDQREMAKLLHNLAKEEVERLFLPYVALQQLSQEATNRGLVLENLKEIITAGEQLHITRSIGKFFTLLKGCTLRNQYGPSESHVVTEFVLSGSPSHWPSLPPLGRPISNTRVYLLDAYLQPVPIGVTGELYIGGEGVARGYLGRPDLTAEKFIPDPFSEKQGGRLYRTGDLARYLPDGNIEFLGRIDRQVKLRGFRIELGEIEAVLTQHPRVREAVALVREEVSGDKRLVAYVVLEMREAVTSSELRSFLKHQLPEYMLPSNFVWLDALPLLPNGKVDREMLPVPDGLRPDLQERFVAPRTPIEGKLAQIWAQVLSLKQVGVHDNFFELGGHSLLATQVIAQVRDVFQVELPLRRLFEGPTIVELSVAIVQSKAEQLDRGQIAKILTELETLSCNDVQMIGCSSDTEK